MYQLPTINLEPKPDWNTSTLKRFYENIQKDESELVEKSNKPKIINWNDRYANR